MCITGIFAFSTVNMMMFIWRALIKTQRLNIRIYSLRTITFIAKYILNKNPPHLKNCVIYKSVLDDKLKSFEYFEHSN